MAGIVDAHVHLLPERLGAAIRRFFTANGIGDFAYPLDHDEVCARLAADGVTTAWTLPYARTPGSAAGLNAACASIAAGLRGGPVEVIGGCTVHPGDDDPVAVVRAAVEDLGLRVLKLHCSVGDYAASDRRLDPVWAYVSSVALPVVVHAGHAMGGGTSAAELAPIAVVAERFPAARLIIAHCGAPAVDAALDLVEAHPNVHADLTPVVHTRVRPSLDRLTTLAEKILFGSDAPNTGLTVQQLLDVPQALPPAARDAILGGTARRLIAAVHS